MGEHDPLIKDALMAIIERGDFIKSIADDKGELNPIKSSRGKSSADILAQIENDPAIVVGLIKRSQTYDSIVETKYPNEIRTGSV